MLSSSLGAQSRDAVEEIVILRSLRLSRVTPTDFCAPSRTGFPPATQEDRYEFRAVATDAASGKVTNVSGARAGTLHACFGPTADPLIVSFYAEGEVGGVPLVGRGQCRATKRDFPEPGILSSTCQLDLTGLPSRYVGGQLTTNTLNSRITLGADTDPPGYTQPSIATVRLWTKRQGQAKPPEWLAILIKTLESEPVANPPARITQFEFRGQTVYYLPPRCCDIPSTLYDAQGAVLCSPDGGFTGRGDGKCTDFFSTRTNERPIWSDKRKRSR
jgi:hypothetical protein